MKGTLSSKGQITLPVEIRRKLGLLPGTRLRFQVREGGVLLLKGGDEEHPVDQVFGTLKLSAPVDRLLDQMRGPRPKKKKK